jgi:hypothetical protein
MAIIAAQARIEPGPESAVSAVYYWHGDPSHSVTAAADLLRQTLAPGPWDVRFWTLDPAWATWLSPEDAVAVLLAAAPWNDVVSAWVESSRILA